MSKLKNHNLLTTKNRYLLVVVFVVCVFVFGVVYTQGIPKTPPQPVADVAVPMDVTATTTIMGVSEPVRLDIPAIELSAPFTEPLGLAANGEVGVPESYTEVGWYKFSPTPGQLGPSVILGHVDSYTGPAVFCSLGNIEVGDEVRITRADGSVAVFEVEGLERYPQSDFPTQRVYGNIEYAGLRLITCSGTYNRGAKRYTHNLVVYAKLKDPVSPQI
jgi:sortase (surface protein transpeptidase)